MPKISDKGEAYAREGRVKIVVSNDDMLIGSVDAFTGTWRVEISPDESTCTCPANTLGHRLCSHIRGVELYERWGQIWEAERRARQREERRRDETQ